MAAPANEIELLRAQVAALEAKVAALQAAQRPEDLEFLRSLLAALPAFVVRISPELKIRYINQLAEGFTFEEAVGSSMFDFISPDVVPTARAAAEVVLTQGVMQRFRGHGQGDHREWADYETILGPVTESDGRRGMILVAFDVSEQAQRERDLARSEEHLRVAIEATGLGLWTWDTILDRVEWSPRMCEIMGRTGGLAPDAYAEVVHPEDRALVQSSMARVLTGEEDAWTAHRIVRPDGEVRWIIPCGRVSRDEWGQPVRIVGGSLDITHIRELEERLHQAQKLESLGTLTAGVAHNFNNLLAVIRPTLDLLQDYVSEEGRPLLGDATLAADRATSVIRQLMTLAGRRRANRAGSSDLGEIATSATQMCQRRFGAEVNIELELEAGPLPILGDGTEVEQVIINLISNARDALLAARTLSPLIRVKVSLAEDVPSTVVAQERGHARVVVQDNGPGVDPSVLARLFDPFFTTKRPGEGTGLGLSISWSVVRSLGGTIECVSPPGAGTRFSVYLPLRPDSAPADPRVHEPGPEAQARRVLVVEDNASVLRVVTQTLQRAGHEVLSAASAARALEVPAEPAVHLVLLDQSLPDRRGTDIVAELRQRWPTARIALFTGEDVPDAERGQVDAVLTKPLSNQELLDAVRALGSGSS